jgi:hypothetical protein
MSLVVLVTFVALGVLILALAAYLLTIAFLLWRIRETAGLILFGLRAIAHQAEPVGQVVGEINADLTGVRDALNGVLAKAGAAQDRREKVDIIEPAVDLGELEEERTDTKPALGATPEADPIPSGGTEHA